jgi:hypothetical protein
LLFGISNDISKLWVSLSDELPNSKALLQEQREYQSNSDDDGLSGNDTYAENILFGGPNTSDPVNLFPTPVQVHILWQNFVSNVDPLTKLVHVPTLENLVKLSTQNVHAVPRNMLALIFSILLVAVVSMSEEECLSQLGLSKQKLMKRFCYATQKCLTKNGILKTTDTTILTSLIYYILAMRYDLDPQTIWSLTGIVMRTAQRIGLHRDDDSGMGKKLSPFEREIRRRVWKHCLIMDWHSSEIAGTTVMHMFFNTKFPSPKNIDDSDLDPAMKSAPQEREGATDMIFCCLRNEFGKFYILENPKQHGLTIHGRPTAELSLDEKDKFIDEMERQLELSYVRYCDPINPLHLLVTLVARTAMTSMRMRAHHPINYSDTSKTVPPEERKKLHDLCIKALRYDCAALSNPALKKYSWHMRSYFQFHPFIYLLVQVRRICIGPEVEEAWRVLDETYKSRSELLDRKTGLHLAAAVLAVRAWDAREGELRRLGQSFEVPTFIQKLRASMGDSSVPSSQASKPPASKSMQAPINMSNVSKKALARQQEWFGSGINPLPQQQHQHSTSQPTSRTNSITGNSGMGSNSFPLSATTQSNLSSGPFLSPSTASSTTAGGYPISPNIMNQQPWLSWSNPRPMPVADTFASLDTNVDNWNMWEQILMNPSMHVHDDVGINALDGFFTPMGNQ